MQFSRSAYRITPLLFVLSLFQLLVVASPLNTGFQGISLFRRQQTTTSCADYSLIANYSAIALNATYRAAFLQASPQGTNPTVAILDTQANKLSSVKFDATLNKNCGNLTTLAAREVSKNFTMGIVGPFTIKKANGGSRVGGEGGLLGTVVLVVTLVGGSLYL